MGQRARPRLHRGSDECRRAAWPATICAMRYCRRCARAGRSARRPSRAVRGTQPQAQRLLESIGRADANRAADGAALSVTALRALAPERRKNALRLWIADRGWPLPDARRLEELAGALLEARADAHPAVEWGAVIAQREGDCLSAPRRDRCGRSQACSATGAWRANAVHKLPAQWGELALEPDEHGADRP